MQFRKGHLKHNQRLATETNQLADAPFRCDLRALHQAHAQMERWNPRNAYYHVSCETFVFATLHRICQEIGISSGTWNVAKLFPRHHKPNT